MFFSGGSFRVLITLNVLFPSVSFQIMPRWSEGTTACSVAKVFSNQRWGSIAVNLVFQHLRHIAFECA